MKNEERLLEETIIEELGHHLDSKLNGSKDRRGDEGSLFRHRINGHVPSVEAIQTIEREDDRGYIIIDGERVEVEFGFFGDLLGGIAKVIAAPFEVVKKVLDTVVPAVIEPVVGFIVNNTVTPIGEAATKILGATVVPIVDGAVEGVTSFIDDTGDSWNKWRESTLDPLADDIEREAGDFYDRNKDTINTIATVAAFVVGGCYIAGVQFSSLAIAKMSLVSTGGGIGIRVGFDDDGKGNKLSEILKQRPLDIPEEPEEPKKQEGEELNLEELQNVTDDEIKEAFEKQQTEALKTLMAESGYVPGLSDESLYDLLRPRFEGPEPFGAEYYQEIYESAAQILCEGENRKKSQAVARIMLDYNKKTREFGTGKINMIEHMDAKLKMEEDLEKLHLDRKSKTQVDDRLFSLGNHYQVLTNDKIDFLKTLGDKKLWLPGNYSYTPEEKSWYDAVTTDAGNLWDSMVENLLDPAKRSKLGGDTGNPEDFVVMGMGLLEGAYEYFFKGPFLEEVKSAPGKIEDFIRSDLYLDLVLALGAPGVSIPGRGTDRFAQDALNLIATVKEEAFQDAVKKMLSDKFAELNEMNHHEFGKAMGPIVGQILLELAGSKGASLMAKHGPKVMKAFEKTKAWKKMQDYATKTVGMRKTATTMIKKFVQVELPASVRQSPALVKKYSDSFKTYVDTVFFQDYLNTPQVDLDLNTLRHALKRMDKFGGPNREIFITIGQLDKKGPTLNPRDIANKVPNPRRHLDDFVTGVREKPYNKELRQKFETSIRNHVSNPQTLSLIHI